MRLGRLFRGKQKQVQNIESITEDEETIPMGIIVIEEDDEKCKRLLENVQKAVEILQSDILVEGRTDSYECREFGVTQMPALILHGKLLTQGKMIETSELIKLLHNYL